MARRPQLQDRIVAELRDLDHRARPVFAEQLRFGVLAVIIGIAGGLAAVGFRLGIEHLQAWVYGTADILQLTSHAQSLAWYWILVIPVIGGLIVGLVLHHFTPDGRVRSVADVIEGAALHNGRVEVRAGIASAIASFVTLATGGSTGREGPIVHLSAVISTKISNWMGANGITARDLLGCAVAAGVSASFNAPLAGTLFALEVILRHFAIHAFAPIAISAVTGTMVSRLLMGNVTEFAWPGMAELAFYAELPAFILLGIVCGIVAVVLMRSIFIADEIATTIQSRSGLPRWLRPAGAGLLLGGIAIFFPHIIGVGYETISAALTGELLLREVIIFAVIKTLAIAITMGGRMGGGVFAPSLMLGALTGLAFGLIASGLVPNMSGGPTLYALAGLGAVSGAVLGAPISTTLIVFELTGDWQTALAVMVAVGAATALAARLVDHSFFLTQLERRDIHLAAGPQAYVGALVQVATIMRHQTEPDAPDETEAWEMIERGIYIDATATLEALMPIFEAQTPNFVPVIALQEEGQNVLLLGGVYYVDALKAYSQLLADAAAEEHS